MRLMPMTRIWGIFCLLMVLLSCTPQYPPNIPPVPVDVTISLLDGQYQNLMAIGGSAYVDGGSRGIIVVRYSFEQFNAYERHCPYDQGACGKVSITDNGLFMVDDDCLNGACGSRFNIINGQVEQGPSTFGLVQYNTSFDGVFLRIFN